LVVKKKLLIPGL